MSTISWKNVFVEQYDVVLAIADGGGDNDKMTFESFLIGNFFFEMYNLLVTNFRIGHLYKSQLGKLHLLSLLYPPWLCLYNKEYNQTLLALIPFTAQLD